MSDEKRFDRRRFFREGLREMLKPLGRAAAPMARAMEQLEALAREPLTPTPSQPANLPAVWLRPPGALFPDTSFRETCSRCRRCIDVCPANCIKIDASGQRGNGAPFIAPEEMPCVVCDGLDCMHNCPTGALSPLPINQINQGTAVWNEQLCLRSKGENCTVCIDTCPIGAVAIELRGNVINVIPEGCTGCGVCQHQCPTEPKSIIVLSREVWERRNG